VKPPIYLCGPTAIGKSAIALELASRLGGEIISVDSMQVYRGMDIGTAKPTPAERNAIPHHLIDVATLTETFDAAQFVRLAKNAERTINVPIYCGGTGLCFNALLQGLGDAPASDPQLRAELERLPLHDLLEELKIKDAATFATIDQKNPRRVIRAIEVIRVSGRLFSEQRSQWTQTQPSSAVIGLDCDRVWLHGRIEQRVDEMFAQGLVAETLALLDQGLRENRTASQALGYKQVIEHLDGKSSLRETVELVKLRTRQFAKRQLTWFRRQLPCQWFQVAAGQSPREVADRLIDIHKLV